MSSKDKLTEAEVNDALTKKLIKKAFDMLMFSYAPYSKFTVGAALLTESGKIYTGCNIENAAYTPSNCAERTAFFKAVSEGEKDFKSICIVGGPKGKVKDYCPPCGVCLQVMMEFCKPDKFDIILAKNISKYKTFKLNELLPEGFGKGNL